MMEIFYKNKKLFAISVNYFRKKLYHRCLIGIRNF